MAKQVYITIVADDFLKVSRQNTNRFSFQNKPPADRRLCVKLKDYEAVYDWLKDKFSISHLTFGSISLDSRCRRVHDDS